MADAGDLKSLALDGRAGSSPALAIYILKAPSGRRSEFFYFNAILFLAPTRRFQRRNAKLEVSVLLVERVLFPLKTPDRRTAKRSAVVSSRLILDVWSAVFLSPFAFDGLFSRSNGFLADFSILANDSNVGFLADFSPRRATRTSVCLSIFPSRRAIRTSVCLSIFPSRRAIRTSVCLSIFPSWQAIRTSVFSPIFPS